MRVEVRTTLTFEANIVADVTNLWCLVGVRLINRMTALSHLLFVEKFRSRCTVANSSGVVSLMVVHMGRNVARVTGVATTRTDRISVPP